MTPSGFACNTFHLGSLGVVDVHRVTPPWHSEDWGMVKELAEVLCIQCGRGDEQLEVWPESGQVLDQPKQHICVERPLMCLVNHHHTVRKTPDL